MKTIQDNQRKVERWLSQKVKAAASRAAEISGSNISCLGTQEPVHLDNQWLSPHDRCGSAQSPPGSTNTLLLITFNNSRSIASDHAAPSHQRARTCSIRNPSESRDLWDYYATTILLIRLATRQETQKERPGNEKRKQHQCIVSRGRKICWRLCSAELSESPFSYPPWIPIITICSRMVEMAFLVPLPPMPQLRMARHIACTFPLCKKLSRTPHSVR